MSYTKTTSIETEEISFKYILRNIWTRQRHVVRMIQEYDYSKYQWLLLCAGSLASTLNRAQQKGISDSTSAASFAIGRLLLPALVGVVFYYILSFAIATTGKLLKGEAYTDSVIRLIAYAQIPAVIGLIMTLPWIAVYGLDFFREGLLTDSNMAVMILFWIYRITNTILALYIAVFMVVGLAEIQHFSIWKAIVNFALPVAVIVLLFALLALPATCR